MDFGFEPKSDPGIRVSKLGRAMLEVDVWRVKAAMGVGGTGSGVGVGLLLQLGLCLVNWIHASFKRQGGWWEN